MYELALHACAKMAYTTPTMGVSVRAYFRALRQCVDFTGRMSRADFCGFIAVQVVLYVIAALAWSGDDNARTTAWTVIFLVHLLPLISAQIRRLRDFGKDGWFILMNLLVTPLVVIPILMMRRGVGNEILAPSPVEKRPHIDLGDLELLANLRRDGALTEAEFQQLKAKLMATEPASQP